MKRKASLRIDYAAARHRLRAVATMLVAWVCAGSARGDTLVYSNTNGAVFFSPSAIGTPIADDLLTFAPCGCNLTSYSVTVSGGGGGPFNANVGLWNGCPGNGGQLILGTTQSFSNIADTGLVTLVVDRSATPVTIPRRVWLQVDFSSAAAGVMVGSPANVGSSQDFLYAPSGGCTTSLGPTIYAAFQAQVYCTDQAPPAAPADPNPPDQSLNVPLQPTLMWNGGALRAAAVAPADIENVSFPAIDPSLVDRGNIDWVDELDPQQWCATQERYAAKGLSNRESRADDSCPLDGVCDMPEVRDTYIPDLDAPPKVYRLSVHVFCNDDGSACTASLSDVVGQIANLNATYLFWRMQFIDETEFVHSTAFRDFVIGEEVALKTAFADSPATKLNVYVVNNGAASSFAVFPWDPDMLLAQGGIIMHMAHMAPGENTLAHEVGHALGLWHTFHGITEVLNCGPCYEFEGSLSDNRGDRCSDTEPAARSFNCFNPSGNEGCSGLPWGFTPYHNYMGYAPSACRFEFTPQQMGRAHCWTEQVASGWLEPSCALTYDVYFGTANPPTTLICEGINAPTCSAGSLELGETYFWRVVATQLGQTTLGPVWAFSTPLGADCNANGTPDAADIAGGGSLDCNANLIPDECEVPPLAPLAPDCNTNGIPDACEVDCQPNGVPDDCDVPPLNPVGADCNANGVPDACETDCQPNGVPDDCEIASGSSLDCQPNGVPDECDLASGASQDTNGNLIPDDCDCPPVPTPQVESLGSCLTAADCSSTPCINGRCYARKNRYISLDIANLPSGELVALRVIHVGSGRHFWIRDHQADDPFSTFRLSNTPICLDWSLSAQVVHVGDCGIVPDSQYNVQAIRCVCDLGAEGQYSAAVSIPTVPEPTPKHWADVTGAFFQDAWTVPNGLVDFNDVLAGVKGFQHDVVAPPIPWLDLHPQTPNAFINFTDIFYVVKGFQGDFYPFSYPAQCP